MKPQTWENQSIYEQTARGTLRITRTLPKGGRGPRLHYHAHTTERITVLIGALDVHFNDKHYHLTTGMGLIIPPGSPHRFEPSGDLRPRIQMEYTPADGMESLFRAIDVARQRKGSELLAIARLTARGGDYILAGPPVWLQRLVFRVWLSALRFWPRVRRRL